MYRNIIQERRTANNNILTWNYTQNKRNMEDAHMQGFKKNKKVTN